MSIVGALKLAQLWAAHAVAASAASAPAVPAPLPTTLPAPDSPEPSAALQLFPLLIWTAFSLSLAAVFHVYRPRTIRGPARLREDESVVPTAAVLALACFAFVAVPSLYVGMTMSPKVIATTQPLPLTNRQKIVMGALAPAGALATAAIGNLLIRPGARPRFGLLPENLLPGIATGILGIAIVFPLMMWVSSGTELVWRAIHYEHPMEHEFLRILGESHDRAVQALVVIAASVIAPVAEEFLFRGHLQTIISTGLGKAFSRERFVSTEPGPSAAARWAAIFITSLCFAGIHPFWMFPPIFFLSVGLGYVYERTGNLYAAMSMHALFNTLSVLLYRYLVGPH